MGGSGRKRTGMRGFTILELLLALTAVTVVGTLSIWAFFSRGEVTLDSAARLLVEDLNRARTRAAFSHSPVAVVFDADGGGYRILEEAGDPTRQPDNGRRYDIDAVFEGVCIETVSGGDRRRLVFDATGSIARASRVVLSYASETRMVELQAGLGTIGIPDSASSSEISR